MCCDVATKGTSKVVPVFNFRLILGQTRVEIDAAKTIAGVWSLLSDPVTLCFQLGINGWVNDALSMGIEKLVLAVNLDVDV